MIFNFYYNLFLKTNIFSCPMDAFSFREMSQISEPVKL